MIGIRFGSSSRLATVAGICLALHVNADATLDKTLFDFGAASNTTAWQIVNDDVMGGLSSGRFIVTQGVAVFRGELSLENNGGFASVRSTPARLDLADGDAFVIRVRSNGQRYKFTARTNPGFDSPIYQLSFPTKRGEWTELRLPMKDFAPTFRGRVLSGQPPLDPARVSSVGFLISDKQAGPFQLEVAWIKATSRGGR